MASRYAALGVSAKKEAVHEAILMLDKGLFPSAFCKIVADHLAQDDAACTVMHADGAGTKSLVAFLQWKESNDATAFRGIAQDALVMNIDDLICVGCVNNPILVSSSIGRNGRTINGELLKVLIDANEKIRTRFNQMGMRIFSTGGETADVGDLVQTLTVDCTVASRFLRKDVIDFTAVRAGDIIIGLASTGKTAYEDEENSGIGSNGLTLARHQLLSSVYRDRHPHEACDTTLDPSVTYTGRYLLSDQLPGSTLTIGQALLSPTRTYWPIIHALLNSPAKSLVHGIVHCTGGGQSKCIHFGKGLRYVKDSLYPCPPLFQAIADSPPARSWKEMYEVFNMGHRMEVRPCLNEGGGPRWPLSQPESRRNKGWSNVSHQEAFKTGEMYRRKQRG
eukprot:GHVT01061651.1.p1 GENE.GHVT01061651.1~~GHVT01061651.1.p1  ORF type:complete len:392 (+),score=48.30 GHVT01061651.1:234-1409(+)